MDQAGMGQAGPQIGTPSTQLIIKPTPKRYIILLLVCLNSANKTYQWLQISAITTKAALYYEVDNYRINMLATIGAFAFLFLSMPACFVINRTGLRKAVLMASFGTALGSILKFYSCYRGGMWALSLAQMLVAVSEQLVYSASSRLASVWFPDHQVSTALSMGVLGPQMGIALGFILPNWLLNVAETKEEIGRGLYQLYLITMAYSIIAFVLDYLLFDEEPEFVPGIARLKQKELERELAKTKSKLPSLKEDVVTLARDIWKLFGNTHLVLLVVSFGIRFGTFDAISALLNQIIMPTSPNNDILVGLTGFMMTIGGIIAVPIWGQYLDRCHRYKRANILSMVVTIFAYCGFVVSLIYLKSPPMMYVTSLIYGISSMGALVAGYELAIELTYPAPELITSSLMNAADPVFFMAMIFVGSHIADNYNPIYVNLFLIGCLLISLILIIFTREILKRQSVVNEGQEKITQLETMDNRSSND